MYDLITWLIEVLVAATQIGGGEVRLVASTLPPQVRLHPQAHSELIERRAAVSSLPAFHALYWCFSSFAEQVVLFFSC